MNIPPEAMPIEGPFFDDFFFAGKMDIPTARENIMRIIPAGADSIIEEITNIFQAGDQEKIKQLEEFFEEGILETSRGMLIFVIKPGPNEDEIRKMIIGN
jgi:hypothetical protein